MKSAVAVCHAIDDAAQCARSLVDSILEQVEPMKHSVGILFCDADLDAAAATAALKARLGFDVAGLTTLAELTGAGRENGAAVLTVLTADDCFFTVVMSDPLCDGNHERAIRAACDRTLETARKAMPRDAFPALAMAFGPLQVPFSGDVYPGIIAEVMGGVPLIGGIASDDYDNNRARIFFSGEESKDRFVLVSIFGNARPLFAIRHVTSRFAERLGRVTEAEKNTVRKIGKETFIEYLEGFGFNTHVDDPLIAFIANPLMLTSSDADEVPVMRHIGGLDHAAGTGIFCGDVPTGVLANVCLLKKEDIENSCRQAMELLLERSKADGGYSTVFCISCVGRAILLGSDGNAEGRIIADLLPEGLALSGAYCVGEICPVRCETREGRTRATNRFHNCSVTFCLL